MEIRCFDKFLCVDSRPKPFAFVEFTNYDDARDAKEGEDRYFIRSPRPFMSNLKIAHAAREPLSFSGCVLLSCMLTYEYPATWCFVKYIYPALFVRLCPRPCTFLDCCGISITACENVATHVPDLL